MPLLIDKLWIGLGKPGSVQKNDIDELFGFAQIRLQKKPGKDHILLHMRFRREKLRHVLLMTPECWVLAVLHFRLAHPS